MQFEQNAPQEFSDKLLDRITGGLLVLEPDLRVCRANRSFCNMLCLAPDEIEGQPFHELCDGQWNKPALWRNLTRIQHGEAAHVEFDIDVEIPPSDARIFRIHGGPLDDLPRILFEVRDVTAERLGRPNGNALVGELHRRMKLLVGNVQSISSTSLRGGRTLEECEVAYLQRLAALDRTHNMLASGDTDLASADDIVRTGIGIYNRWSTHQVAVGGEPVRLGHREAETLALVVHELSTNALKHGALAGSSGSVDVFWQADWRSGRKHFFLEWRESGVPAERRALPADKKGDGIELIKFSVRLLGGTVDFHSDSAGITCTVCFPLAEGMAHAPTPASSAAAVTETRQAPSRTSE